MGELQSRFRETLVFQPLEANAPVWNQRYFKLFHTSNKVYVKSLQHENYSIIFETKSSFQ